VGCMGYQSYTAARLLPLPYAGLSPRFQSIPFSIFSCRAARAAVHLDDEILCQAKNLQKENPTSL
jgi:hypothetical protein